MENQNMNQNTNGTAPEQQEKTFTQEQVNAIIGKRLAEVKASGDAELSRREKELNEREMQLRAKELLAENNLPKELAEVLKYTDEDSLEKAVGMLAKLRGFNKNEPSSVEMKIEPFRLPDSTGEPERDPIRHAMGLD